jgi:hypothetical protein
VSFQPNSGAGITSPLSPGSWIPGLNKTAGTMHPNQATQQSAANFFARIIWPYTGTIDRLMVFCTAIGTSTTIELGVYDTSATTRNRLTVVTGVSLVTTSYVAGTVSLAVIAGDSADLGYATNNGNASFAGNTMNTSGNMARLPAGWMPVSGGGQERMSYFLSGITSLATTFLESNMSLDVFCPLILARYA